jgi:hypothetical protein
VGGSLDIGTGWGEDGVTLLNLGVGGSVTVASAGDELGVTFDDGIGVRGNVSVQGTNTALDAFLDEMFVGGALSVGADGPLAVRIEDSGIRGGVTVMGGRWDSLVSIDGIGTTNLTIGTGMALPGATPGLNAEVRNTGLAGDLSIMGGVGFGGGVTIANVGARGSIDVLFYDADGEGIDLLVGGGSPADQVVAGGGISLAGYNGEFLLDMQYVTTGGSLSIAGNLLMDVQGRYLAARGDFNADIGPGFGLIQVQNVGFGGDLNVTGAEGIEGLEVIDAGVRGDVNVNTGDGSVEALIGGVGIGGSLNVSNGAGAFAGYEIVETTVRGNVNVQSSALLTEAGLVVAVGGNVNVQTGVGPDEVWIEDSLIRGTTVINTDGGHDDVILNNSTFVGLVTINTGGGEDWVAIAHYDAEPFGQPAIFASGLTVNLQGDADMLEIGFGSDPGETAEFYGPVNANGGPGSDLLYLGGFNTFSQVPSFTSFETIV